MTIEELLNRPYWIIDILPKQVPASGPGQFFAVERYFLEKSRIRRIKQQHIDLILKLNCYYSLSLDDEEETDPLPQRIEKEMLGRYVYIRFKDCMILSEPDDTHMTVFNPDEELLQMIKTLAAGEGLYVWKP